MKPPIKVTVTTDNMNTCELRLQGAEDDGTATAITVGSSGNVYQGLHKLRGPLEEAINQLLEVHGIYPDAPPAVDVDLEDELAPVTEPGPPHTDPEPSSYVAIGSAQTWDGRQESAEHPLGGAGVPALAVVPAEVAPSPTAPEPAPASDPKPSS